MPVFYNYTENGVVYSFDDVFVPADAFRPGNLWAWGRNYFGTLGNNTSSNASFVPTPVTTFAGSSNWKQVSIGFRISSAIKTDGTLWTWGLNNGRIGNNTGIPSPICTPVTTFAGGTNWKQVSSDSDTVSAIKTDGTLWTWGDNFDGALGTNTRFDIRCTPVTTFAGGTNWKQVSCGRRHTAAIKTDGTLWTWGDNQYGNLGNNATSTIQTPVTTFAGGTNWRQVSCGTNNTAAIKTDGTLWVWGRNNQAQMGNGSQDGTNRLTPVTTFAGGTNWKQVSCNSGVNGTFIASVKTDGTLWLWGNNSYGQLGDRSTFTKPSPVTTFLGGTNWKQVSCGYRHVAAIKTDGTLWNWGSNDFVQLGTGYFQGFNFCTPTTTFLGGSNWKQVSCAQQNTAATTYIDDYQ
jgi:alpha-tubulin suppressor-like RCC1 family protein